MSSLNYLGHSHSILVFAPHRLVFPPGRYMNIFSVRHFPFIEFLIDHTSQNIFRHPCTSTRIHILQLFTIDFAWLNSPSCFRRFQCRCSVYIYGTTFRLKSSRGMPAIPCLGKVIFTNSVAKVILMVLPFFWYIYSLRCSFV